VCSGHQGKLLSFTGHFCTVTYLILLSQQSSEPKLIQWYRTVPHIELGHEMLVEGQEVNTTGRTMHISWQHDETEA